MANYQGDERKSLTGDVERAGTERTMPDMDQLSQAEKLALISGKSVWLTADLPRFDLRSIRLSDGPHGVRVPKRELSLHDSHPATCFPTAAALACGWDANLMRTVGETLATECEAYGVSVLLGPGMNLKRHPAGGRNFEYLSEDPYLTGRLAAAYIGGIQSTGRVGACAKHFAVNNQEDHRFVVNALADERTVREMYLAAFHHVICGSESPPETLMSAYNRINGTFASEHHGLCRRILRDEWHYEGVLMTDWGATNDRAAGVMATVDLEMPGSHGVQNRALRQALKDDAHALTVDDLDASAARVLRLIARHQPTTSSSSDESSSQQAPTQAQVDWKVHHDIAKIVALECAVLLKNDNLLPLRHDTKIALIGDFAMDHPRYQGMGSSQVTTDGVVSAYEEAARYTRDVLFATGYHYDDDHPEDVDAALLQEAIQVAMQAEVAILFIGLPEIMESEAFDRAHLGLPAQHNALVTEICAVHDKVVVVLSNGGPVELPWADQPKAILEGYLLGESGGAAILDLIFGLQSPCGRLAETFPMRQADILADRYFPGTQDRVEYREGLNVGYRYFDSAAVPVRFPFGHGLTYTTFEYGNLEVSIVDKSPIVDIRVSVQITNSGSWKAKEVVQCYVHANDSAVYRPDQELKAFSKVLIDPGSVSTIEFRLAAEAFSFYDVGAGRWVLENGSYEIRVGMSSRDIRLRHTILIDMGEHPSELAKSSYPPQHNKSSLVVSVSDEDFYGRFVTDFGPRASLEWMNAMPITPFHRNTLLKDLSRLRLFGKLLIWIVYLGASADVKPGPTQARQKRLARIAVDNLPLRTLVLFSRGGMSYELLDAILALMNYQLCSAFRKFATAFTPWRK